MNLAAGAFLPPYEHNGRRRKEKREKTYATGVIPNKLLPHAAPSGWSLVCGGALASSFSSPYPLDLHVHLSTSPTLQLPASKSRANETQAQGAARGGCRTYHRWQTLRNHTIQRQRQPKDTREGRGERFVQDGLGCGCGYTSVSECASVRASSSLSFCSCTKSVPQGSEERGTRRTKRNKRGTRKRGMRKRNAKEREKASKTTRTQSLPLNTIPPHLNPIPIHRPVHVAPQIIDIEARPRYCASRGYGIVSRFDVLTWAGGA